MFSALRAPASVVPRVASPLAIPPLAHLSRGIATSAAARDISRLTLVGRVAHVSDPRQTAHGAGFVA